MARKFRSVVCIGIVCMHIYYTYVRVDKIENGWSVFVGSLTHFHHALNYVWYQKSSSLSLLLMKNFGFVNDCCTDEYFFCQIRDFILCFDIRTHCLCCNNPKCMFDTLGERDTNWKTIVVKYLLQIPSS